MDHDHAPGGHPEGPADPDEVGSVTDEAERLYAALGDWARDIGAVGGLGDPGEHGEHGDHGASCTWCPLCRALDVVRSASPEVRAQLGVAATALLRAGAGFLAGLDDGRARSGAPTPDQEQGGTPVQRIELDDELDEHDDDGWEA